MLKSGPNFPLSAFRFPLSAFRFPLFTTAYDRPPSGRDRFPEATAAPRDSAPLRSDIEYEMGILTAD